MHTATVCLLVISLFICQTSGDLTFQGNGDTEEMLKRTGAQLYVYTYTNGRKFKWFWKHGGYKQILQDFNLMDVKALRTTKREITNGYIQLPDKKIQVYLHKRGEVYYVNVGPDEDGINMVVKYYDIQ